MALSEKTWTPISVNEMIAAYLQGEQHRFSYDRYREGRNEALYDSDRAIITHPDFNSPEQNSRRLRLYYTIRGPMMTEIPPDTQWYKISSLQNDDLTDLHIIARCGWDDKAGHDKNELLLAAKRNPKILKTLPSEWPPVILWGHGKSGPFTIVEGNNRLAGYVVTPEVLRLDVPVIVGLSTTFFYYHIFDPPNMIADDLWHNMPEEGKRPNPLALNYNPVVPKPVSAG